ncbi:MAG TPA: nucleotidyltransferase domain-containing protein [Thermodesulfovibrionia bacterium]|nr:nucleotidyltransferase domain-containing protein [Thermodesulfovibrionia bacterium]
MINTQEITSKITGICEQYPSIIAAYLFGSIVKQKKIPEDIDIALLLDNVHESAFSLLDFITEIEKNCRYRADVVILNKAAELVKYEVRRSGAIIFERDKLKRIEFEIYSRKTFEDFLYLHKRYVNTVLYKKQHG